MKLFSIKSLYQSIKHKQKETIKNNKDNFSQP